VTTLKFGGRECSWSFHLSEVYWYDGKRDERFALCSSDGQPATKFHPCLKNTSHQKPD
ncbi:29589_t:CDS:1, partial [Gigaspora margarita]